MPPDFWQGQGYGLVLPRTFLRNAQAALKRSKAFREPYATPQRAQRARSLHVVSKRALKGRTEKHPPLMPDPGHASLSVSWVGHLRGCNSHGGAAPRRAFGAGGCPFTGRDRSGDPLHTELWFWRLLLALNAVATPEAVLGECIAMLLRQSIEPLRRLHR